MKKKYLAYFFTIQLLVSPLASAHSLEMVSASSLISGVLHPLLGLDHLVILLAMGMIVGKLTKTKQVGALCCTALVALMVVGLVVGLVAGAHVGAPDVIEIIIAGSIFLAAFALWQSTSSHGIAKILFVLSSVTLLAHGWAHGVEMGHASIVMFTLGMGMSSMLCTAIGVYLAQRISAPILASTVASSGLLLTMIG